METDLFASIRKQDTGVSTSFAPATATPKHGAPTDETPQDLWKSATKHLQPPKHPEEAGDRIHPLTNRWVTVPEILAHDNGELQPIWRDGLNRLNAMPAPRAARPGRWRELVIDAHCLAWGWHDIATDRGWSIEALFAFNAKDPFQDEAGLVFSIRGARVLSLFDDERGRAVAAICGDLRRRPRRGRRIPMVPPPADREPAPDLGAVRPRSSSMMEDDLPDAANGGVSGVAGVARRKTAPILKHHRRCEVFQGVAHPLDTSAKEGVPPSMRGIDQSVTT